MKDPYNPTAEELKSWAYDAGAEVPKQDWDLLISTSPYENLFLELASDVNCPKTHFFMSLLYLIVGNAVRTNFRARSKASVEDLLLKAEKDFPKRWIYIWVQRSRDLIAHPEQFDYSGWCGGRLADDDFWKTNATG